MARRAAEIKSQREKDPELLLLSAGDFYAHSGIAEMYRSRFLSSLMMDLGYDAVAVGENELGYGLRAILEDAEAGLPVICANLYRDGERIFRPYIVKKVRGARVGIFALLGEEASGNEGIELRDPVSEGIEAAEELAQRCDFTILLAHMDRQKLEVVLSSVEGIDLVVRGHSGSGAAPADDCADTLGGAASSFGVPVLFAGDKGKALGFARISKKSGGSALLEDTVLVRLDNSIPRDPVVWEKVMQFSQEEGERLRELSLSEFLSRDGMTGKIRERFLGMETCARCHEKVMSDFIMTPHFRAFARLTASGEEKNQECLACHATGYGQFSGYDPAAEQKGAVNLRGVQCEACHGQGTTHARDGAYAGRSADSCRRCHTAKWSPDFEFETYMRRFGTCGKYARGPAEGRSEKDHD